MSGAEAAAAATERNAVAISGPFGSTIADAIAAADAEAVQRENGVVDQRAQAAVVERRRVMRRDGDRFVVP